MSTSALRRALPPAWLWPHRGWPSFHAGCRRTLRERPLVVAERQLGRRRNGGKRSAIKGPRCSRGGGSLSWRNLRRGMQSWPPNTPSVRFDWRKSLEQDVSSRFIFIFSRPFGSETATGRAASPWPSARLPSAVKPDLRLWGHALLAMLARVTDDHKARYQALHEAEAVLEGGCVSHNYFFFCRDAMEVCLAVQDWDRIEHYASFLERYTQPEPQPWSEFYILRARSLSAYGSGRRGRDGDAAASEPARRSREGGIQTGPAAPRGGARGRADRGACIAVKHPNVKRHAFWFIEAAPSLAVDRQSHSTEASSLS